MLPMPTLYTWASRNGATGEDRGEERSKFSSWKIICTPSEIYRKVIRTPLEIYWKVICTPLAIYWKVICTPLAIYLLSLVRAEYSSE